MLAGGLVETAIEDFEECGSSQAAGAEVEAEVGQGVKLALGKRDLDQAVDGLLGLKSVLGEDALQAWGSVIPLGERFMIKQAVKVAYSRIVPP